MLLWELEFIQEKDAQERIQVIYGLQLAKHVSIYLQVFYWLIKVS